MTDLISIRYFRPCGDENTHETLNNYICVFCVLNISFLFVTFYFLELY